MSIAGYVVVSVVGGLLGLVAFLRMVAAWENRRALRGLPPNTSGGVPVVPTRRERWLAGLFFGFVLGVVLWLVLRDA
jgi:hypothetical protein